MMLMFGLTLVDEGSLVGWRWFRLLLGGRGGQAVDEGPRPEAQERWQASCGRRCAAHAAPPTPSHALTSRDRDDADDVRIIIYRYSKFELYIDILPCVFCGHHYVSGSLSGNHRQKTKRLFSVRIESKGRNAIFVFISTLLVPITGIVLSM